MWFILEKSLLGLDIPADLSLTEDTSSNVRQSRRIAQLKIKEDAERITVEEMSLADRLALVKKQKKLKNKQAKEQVSGS